MKLIATLSILAALAFASVASAAVTTREFEGTVVSVDRAAKTFRLDDSERGTVRITVTSRTRFERVRFSTLKAGAKNIEVVAKRSNGRWVATEVERSGGGGNHGGDDSHDD